VGLAAVIYLGQLALRPLGIPELEHHVMLAEEQPPKHCPCPIITNELQLKKAAHPHHPVGLACSHHGALNISIEGDTKASTPSRSCALLGLETSRELCNRETLQGRREAC
jgi:hypothetical protein